MKNKHRKNGGNQWLTNRISGPTALVLQPMSSIPSSTMMTSSLIYWNILKLFGSRWFSWGPDIQMIDNAPHVKPAGSRSHIRMASRRSNMVSLHRSMDKNRPEYAWQQMQACERPFLKIKIFFCVDDVDEKNSSI